MIDFERAAAAIAGLDPVYLAGPKDPSLVAAAETALGVTFPPTYRRFVSEYGAGIVGSHEFYGVVKDNFSGTPPDGIGVTLRERAKWNQPHDLIIVGDTGMGEYYVIDVSQRDDVGESPVVIWEPGRSWWGDPLEFIASDFGSFFRQMVEEQFGRALQQDLAVAGPAGEDELSVGESSSLDGHGHE